MMEKNTAHSTIASVISSRLFRYLWFGQIASQLAMNILVFLMAMVVYQRTNSNTAVSGLFLAYGIPAFLFGTVAGVVVDQIDRRTILVLCDVSRAILVFLLFFLSGNITVVYLFVFINAIITQFYVPAEAPMIPHTVPTGQLVTANSLFSFTYYSSMALGFIFAGPILRLLGPEISLLAISGLFILASLNVSRLPSQRDGMTKILRIWHYDVAYLFQRVAIDLKTGFSYVLHKPSLVDALLLLTGTQIIIAILGTLGPGFADRALHIDVRDTSIVIVGPVVTGIILGALWVGQRGVRFGSQRLIQIGVLTAGILLILITISSKLGNMPLLQKFLPSWSILFVELVLFFFLGLANSLLDVPANSILQKEASDDVRSRVYGILTATIGGIGVLPVILGGVLADTIGADMVILLMGVVIVGYGLWRNKRVN